MVLEYSTLLDYAAKIGMQAALENITKTQVENLLASLDLVEDPRISFPLVSAFAYRQAARHKKGYNTARIVDELMDKLYKSGEEKEKAKFVLGLAKWIYEIADNYKLPKIVPEINVNTLTFEKFLEILRGRRHK